MPEEFYRIKRLPPYVFAEVNALKAQARAPGATSSISAWATPTGRPPPHIVAKLIEAVQNPKAHGYSASRGIPGLRRAYAAYYARRFNVELDPEREIIVTLGSKEGLANLAQAITAPGDTILVPNPCYPIHSFGFIMAGAAVRACADRPRCRFSRRAEKGGAALDPGAAGGRAEFPGQPDRADRRSRFLRRDRRFLPPPRHLSCCPTSPMPRSISTASRRPRSSKCRGRATSRSSSPRSARPIRWPAGGSASRSATSG